MKAAVLFGNEDMRYADWETPMCLPGTVKIRVRAAGICGSDVPRVLHHGAHFYPVILGHEFSGDVVEVGENVTRVKVGDRVSGAPLIPCMRCADCLRENYALCKHYSFIGSRQQGAFADYLVIPQPNAVRYDPKIPYEQAAMFEPSTVAVHGLLQANYRPGGQVAILGCGTIGIFTLQWAKILGGQKTVAFDIDPKRLHLALDVGADEAINTREASFMETAMKITGGAGFDYVLETAGQPVTMRMAFELAANQASVCFIGTPHTELAFTPMQWENMNRKEFRLTGSWMSYSGPFPGREWTMTADAFASGALQFHPALIDQCVPMREAAAAFARYRHPQQVHGKIILTNP